MCDNLRYFAGAARNMDGRATGEYLEGYTSWIRREPIGVVGQITPWNYPMMMAIWKIAPALAAGNTLVLKPAETTPMSTLTVLGRSSAPRSSRPAWRTSSAATATQPAPRSSGTRTSAWSR